MSSTEPEDPAAVDWTALRGRRVVLDDGWTGDEHPIRHQGVVSGVDVEAGRADGIELTLIRYDGSTRLLRPVGRFTVTGGDTGEVLYTPAVRVPRKIPMDFVEAVRKIAPDRWQDLERAMRTTPADPFPGHKAKELVDLAAQVEWECTRERDVLEDPSSPSAAYAEAARRVVEMWEETMRPRDRVTAADRQRHQPQPLHAEPAPQPSALRQRDTSSLPAWRSPRHPSPTPGNPHP